MTTDEQAERTQLAAMPGLPEYTRQVVLHHTTPLSVARQLVVHAREMQLDMIAAARACVERLDREMGLATPAAASFDAKSQVQQFGASEASNAPPPEAADGAVVEMTFEQHCARNRGR